MLVRLRDGDATIPAGRVGGEHALVLADRAALFVDGRYTVQARDEVDAAAFAIEHLVEQPPPQWIEDNLPAGAKLGYSPWLHTVDGAERLAATLDACRRYLPPNARWTRPQGGMNVWVRLPEPLDAGELLPRAQKEGVAYLPGRYFAVSRLEPGALRLSFAGLTPDQIRSGLAILGRIVSGEIEAASGNFEPASAMV